LQTRTRRIPTNNSRPDVVEIRHNFRQFTRPLCRKVCQSTVEVIPLSRINADPARQRKRKLATNSRPSLFEPRTVCYPSPLVLSAAKQRERPPGPNIDGNGVVMKVKLTTKQKRDRRWKIKRRKLRRQKTGL
jgi:hypothetical protein